MLRRLESIGLVTATDIGGPVESENDSLPAKSANLATAKDFRELVAWSQQIKF